MRTSKEKISTLLHGSLLPSSHTYEEVFCDNGLAVWLSCPFLDGFTEITIHEFALTG